MKSSKPLTPQSGPLVAMLLSVSTLEDLGTRKAISGKSHVVNCVFSVPDRGEIAGLVPKKGETDTMPSNGLPSSHGALEVWRQREIHGWDDRSGILRLSGPHL